MHWNISALEAVLSFVAGGALGSIYFAGLWLTVRRLHKSRRPRVRIAASFLGRLTVVLLGFYIVMGHGSWERMLVCLLGFFVARTVLVHRLL